MRPVPADIAALFVRLAGFRCSESTLRQWVCRGNIRRSAAGYDLGSIADYLDTRS